MTTTQTAPTLFCEIKNADDGDYTDGLVVCDPCAKIARAEGFRVTAWVTGPAQCCSCGIASAETSTYTVKAVSAEWLRTGEAPNGLIEEEREYKASSLGEALAMAEANDAGRADFVYGILPEDYDRARAEGLSFNEADGLLTDAS